MCYNERTFYFFKNGMLDEQLTKKQRKELHKYERALKQKKERQRSFIRRVALWAAVFAGAGLVVAGIAWLGNTSPSGDIELPIGTAVSSDRTKGADDAPVVLVEYSDFQCPACGRYYPVVKELMQEFGSRVRLVYRHFPLRNIHQNAELAARAAEAAGNQGKFWDMHDKLFEGQKEWSEQSIARVKDSFVQYARELGLDKSRFEQDINTDEVKKKVEADYQSGVRAGVRGTPTFFLNGKKIANPRSYDIFSQLISYEISQIP